MFIAAQLTIAKFWKQPKCPSANEWIKKKKEKSRQNITKDIEIKNNVTIAIGEWGGEGGERGIQELL